MRRLLLVAMLLLTSVGAVSPAPDLPDRRGQDECAHAGTSDFDGDGDNDAVAGDPFGADGAGRLFLLGGGSAGLLNPVIKEFAAGAPGWTARAGHLDGDRCLDLVVTNPFAYGTAGSAQVRGAGVAYVYWGGRDFGRTGAARLELKAPMARTGAHFGWSVAVSDGPESGAGFGIAPVGATGAGGTGAGGTGGGSVLSGGAGGGGTLVVGAPHEYADEVANSGAVYVYQFSGRDPGRPQRITQNTPGVPGSGEAGDMFGWSVALGRLGGYPNSVDLAVGAPFEDREETSATDSGGVTVIYDVSTRPWSYSGAGWDLSSVTNELSPATGDHLGYSVAYGRQGDHGYLAAGAPGADPGGVRDAGAVLLFETTGTGPRFLRVLRQGTAEVGDTTDERDRFGFAVAFSTTSPAASPAASLTGSSTFLGPDSSGTSSRASSGASSGEWAAALGGAFLVVGVPGESYPTAPESGAVHLLPIEGVSGGRMIREAQPGAYDHFGWSVSGAGDDWLLVGAPDRGVTGAVTVMGSGNPHELFPPHADPSGKNPLDFGLDFGATLAG
ncbi:hypothetical protein N5079_15115 [Planotetraspora sp. A-T 1434]|uniref:hypothetical protein n=1 Tax=Planotetraspora sp. A-T 1434 TaxID=2979219 RepID=UPI0021C0B210|nr:hypothetical protein [Planotetraspora sp. A-T 1434]MCT9931545.1 hypothetical protein [Planotetraspora sp. A-T 1434]